MTDFRKLTKEAIKAAGGENIVADAIKRTRQAVNLWNKVPAHHVQTLARLSGKQPHEIRPDIFGVTPMGQTG